MFSWVHFAVARASTRNRRTIAGSANSRNLIATLRPSLVSRARNTCPIPPRASSRISPNRPISVFLVKSSGGRVWPRRRAREGGSWSANTFPGGRTSVPTLGVAPLGVSTIVRGLGSSATWPQDSARQMKARVRRPSRDGQYNTDDQHNPDDDRARGLPTARRLVTRHGDFALPFQRAGDIERARGLLRSPLACVCVSCIT